MTARKYLWGALVIIAMWVAVLIVGVVGEGEFLARHSGSEVRIPMVWGIALFALIGSWVVAWVAFRDTPRAKGEAEPPPPAA